MDASAFKAAVIEIGLRLSDEQVAKFQVFEDNLYKANEVMNLTRVPRDEAWLRHFVDSLLFHDLVPLGQSVLDIGTGPGFPAWPLACARPDLQVYAMDSSGKMLGFLSHNLLPNLKTMLARAEEWTAGERFGVVMGRALAPLMVQLEISAAPAKVGGIVIPMRTPAERGELPQAVKALGLELRDVHERRLPGSDIVRLFPVYEKTGPTEKGYPRTWAEIKRKPLT